MGQIAREEREVVGRALQVDHGVDGKESSFDGDPAAASPAPGAIEPPDDLLLGDEQIQREVGMGDEIAKADQLGEGVVRGAVLWRLPARWRFSSGARELDDPQIARYRVNELDAVTIEEIAELAGDGGEVGGLDLDQEVAAPDIDDIAIDERFAFVAGLEVPLAEGGVERAFVEGTDGCRNDRGSFREARLSSGI